MSNEIYCTCAFPPLDLREMHITVVKANPFWQESRNRFPGRQKSDAHVPGPRQLSETGTVHCADTRFFQQGHTIIKIITPRWQCI